MRIIKTTAGKYVVRFNDGASSPSFRTRGEAAAWAAKYVTPELLSRHAT